MKFSCSAVAALFVAASSSLLPATEAFAGLAPTSSFVPSRSGVIAQSRLTSSRIRCSALMTMSADSGYTVAIVGATGAVGKEIRQCLEKSSFPVEKLRIFGSERSAGSTIASDKFGDVKVELFSVDAARECDVVFLAVSGDFALEHAQAISDGDDGAVVIDNSVRTSHSLLHEYHYYNTFAHTACAVCLSIHARNPLGGARD